jgi:hypothetical protein
MGSHSLTILPSKSLWRSRDFLRLFFIRFSKFGFERTRVTASTRSSPPCLRIDIKLDVPIPRDRCYYLVELSVVNTLVCDYAIAEDILPPKCSWLKACRKVRGETPARREFVVSIWWLLVGVLIKNFPFPPKQARTGPKGEYLGKNQK